MKGKCKNGGSVEILPEERSIAGEQDLSPSKFDWGASGGKSGKRSGGAAASEAHVGIQQIADRFLAAEESFQL